MGTWIGITIKNHDFLWAKNSFGDLLKPFSPANLILEEATDDEGEKYTRRYFSLNVKEMIQVLDSLGHTLSKAKEDFERSKNEEIEFIEYCLEHGHDLPLTKEDLQSYFTFDAWKSAAHKYACWIAEESFAYKQLDEMPTDELSISEELVFRSLSPTSENYFGLLPEQIDQWNIFRVLLEAFDSKEKVFLDYTELYEAGWCGEYPSEEEYADSKTIILTEGKFDAEVIEQSMNLLFPHMSKFYAFINFGEYSVQGSTNFLTHYLRAFAASGIKNRVIALYDNDSAGLAEMKLLEGIKMPDNFRVMTLPNVEFAKEYPTLGPNGLEKANINGRACSIELFLGQDILIDENGLIPIHWKGYNEKVETYQGEIMHKRMIQDHFWAKMKTAKQSDILEQEAWKEMKMLLNAIFTAFQ